MIFRLTQKLARKIKVTPTAALPPHDDPFLDWTAHLFMVSRWQCIILTNSASLYSVILPGKGTPNKAAFIENGVKALRENLAQEGILDLFKTRIAPATNSIRFSKTGDRSVLGSINDLTFHTRWHLIDEGLPLSLVNYRINRIPQTKLKHCFSIEELVALANESQT